MKFDYHFLFSNFPELTVGGLAFGAIYALVALGYTLVYGVLQLINFAHSEVFMYGTFAAMWTVMILGGTSSTSTGAAIGFLLVALIVAMVVSGGIALLLERVAYRPLIQRNAPRLIALISAIGASFFLAELMGLRQKVTAWVGLDDNLNEYVTRPRDPRSWPRMLDQVDLFSIGGFTVRSTDALVIVSAIVMMVVLDQFVRRSKTGRGIRATAQDPETALLMGVNSTRVIQMTFLIGGLMAGAAAFLYMFKIGTTKFDVGFILGVKAFTAAVLGGIGNLRGALLGGLVLGVAESWGSGLFGTEWRSVVAFVLLVVILLFRPTGLLGEALGKART
ncbi:branched-chain amino acid ABC transporter permease [Nocardioides sp. InS609-2]|uniref:branched-chain amino acid ABC transporter permease n=1 Tax=Nocardioides sp. InS609-2 TaxID=2760705 RepID=UPI0017DB49ED|nr:branched-chain amino acid ABC transporter permease [Nocardioides sp. InS609-2]MBA3781120.1 branched-chain amino acid ABC transporter permease [Nocardioides sp.]